MVIRILLSQPLNLQWEAKNQSVFPWKYRITEWWRLEGSTENHLVQAFCQAWSFIARCAEPCPDIF